MISRQGAIGGLLAIAALSVLLAVDLPFALLLLAVALGLRVLWHGIRRLRQLRSVATAQPSRAVPTLELRLLMTAIGLCEYSQTIGHIVVLALSVLLAVRVFRGLKIRPQRPAPILVVFLGLAAIAWYRQPASHQYLTLLVLLSPAIVALIALSRTHSRALAPALVDSVGIYLLANVVAYFFLGLHTNATRTANLDVSGGPFAERVTFPLTGVLVVPPTLAAAYVSGALLNALPTRGRFERWGRHGLLAAAAIVLLGANVRIAVAVGPLVGLVYLMSGRVTKRVAALGAAGALLLPIWLGSVRWVAEPVAERASSVSYFSRGESDPLSFQGRDAIWQATLRRYGQLSAKERAVGFGALGQVESGASAIYGPQFVGYGDTRLITPHNSVLQSLLDEGILGAATLVVMVFWIVRTVVTADERAARRGAFLPLSALAAMVTTIAITGATDSTLAAGPGQAPFWLLVIAGAVVSGAGVRHHVLRRTGPVPADVSGRS